MLLVNIITAYPEMFPGTLGHSIIGKAIEEKKFSLNIINLHNYGFDSRKNIDDEPFGGGPGMIIRPDVVEKALLSINLNPHKKSHRIYLSPSGKRLNQIKLKVLSQFDELIILCGRFEGVDQRAIDVLNFEEISIGDYILPGGESAAQVLVEGCIRLIPGVLGQPESLFEESFSNDLLEYPQYTRPQVWKDAKNEKHEVPEVLISGHHEKIKDWRYKESVNKTKLVRPDLNKTNTKEYEK